MLINNMRISRVYIENFKSIEKAVLGFSNQTLTVLDGPNGFGKTSIYDAIELLLTGSIRRVQQLKITVGNRGYDDYLFAKDQSKPIILKLEIEISDDDFRTVNNIFIGRKIEPKLLNRLRKKPSDFDYSVHVLEAFEENLSNGNKTTQTAIEELLGIPDLASKFSLYHYIEQEESTHLLKKNEKERMDSISKLFNIESEVLERDILEKAKNKLVRFRTDLNQKINGTIIDPGDIDTNVKEINYFQLVNLPSNMIIWDQEVIKPLDKKNKAMYIEQLESIKSFVINFDDFKIELLNEKIRAIVSRNDKLSALIVLGYFDKMLDNIFSEYDFKQKLKNIKSKIENKEIFSMNMDWDFIYNNFSLSINKEDLLKKINFITGLKSNTNNISNIVEKLLSSRNDLVLSFNEYINKKDINGNDCPLCGRGWESYKELIEQIDKKTELFKRELDSSSKVIFKETELLYGECLSQLVIKMEDVLLNLVDDAFISQLNEHKKLNVNIEAAKKFFEELNIDVSIYFNKEKILVNDIDSKVEIIKELLNSRLIKTNLEIDKFYEFKELYRDLFNNNEEIIKSLKVENINLKKQYIEYMYYLQANELFIKNQKLTKQLKELEESINLLSQSIKIYNEKINGYRAKMINEVEIPFYIYSGKIIQNHQRGVGVFIKEEQNESLEDMQLKAINFVPPERTDHDIIHSFSSGQLSATVLAFSLALNKVYNSSGLLTLLIDDPIQSMDEINMASLVELLRNDFADRQIILSTHEDKISMYIRYKFSKYNLKTGKINVKEEFY